MPIVQYVVVVGGLLFSLLFAADHFLSTGTAPATETEVDRSIIRISSTRPLPEKIVFDVSHPPVPATSDVTEVAHESSAREPLAIPRDALAMIPQDRAGETQPARAVTERIPKHRHAARPLRRTFERRLAFDHREFPGNW